MDLTMSALPSEADIRAGLQDVCFVPTADSKLSFSSYAKSVSCGLDAELFKDHAGTGLP
jgi:hypothetical protein